MSNDKLIRRYLGVYIYTFISICIYMYICIYTYVHIQIHIQIHIQKAGGRGGFQKNDQILPGIEIVYRQE